MNNPDDPARTQAWLELPDGNLHWVGKECRIGRSKDINDLVIDERPISSRHVNLVCGAGGYTLIDQHSTNGTHLNGLLVQKAVELKDGDEIRLAKIVTLRFRCTRQFQPAGPIAYDETTAQISQVEAHDCWLLLVDVAGYSALIADLGSEAALERLQKWIGEVRPLIESNGGAINSYIGDAILAYWPSLLRTPQQVLDALDALDGYRALSPVAFRIVVHHGIVLFSRSNRGEEVSGQDVNFVFRSEKIAKRFACSAMLSHAAVATLRIQGRCDQAGTSAVDGIAGQFAFFRFRVGMTDDGGQVASPMKRILLVEEARDLDDRIEQLLKADGKLEVSDRAQHGTSARKLHEKLNPHLVIIDLVQRTGEAVALTRDLLGASSQTRVLIYTTLSDLDYIGRALRAGARGYVLKSDPRESMLDAIRVVLEGGLFLSPQIAGPLLQRLPGYSGGGSHAGTISLSDQEVEVFRLIALGQTSQLIASALGLKIAAVETLQLSLKVKLQLRSTEHLGTAAKTLSSGEPGASDGGG